MRIAVYVRVSTPNQVHQQTIDQQLDRLRTHLQAQGLTLTEQAIFRDDGYSGARLNRPGLDRLRDAIRERSIDQVLLTAPDRLARKYVHQMLLLEEFESHGVQVEFLDRPMTQDPHDQLLLQIRGAVAEYERVLIAERMRRGRQAKLRAGVLLPWTRAPYGYRLHPDRPRDPNGVTLEPAEAAIVAEVFALYREPGVSLLQLTRTLNERRIPSPTGKPVWAAATLRGILMNPSYTGQVYIGRVRYRAPSIRRSATHPIGHPGETATPLPPDEWIPVATVPGIITREQFDLVQAKMAKNQCFSHRNNTVHPYLLRALVSCGYCQHACIGRTAVRSPYSYYMCSSKIGWKRLGRPLCHARFAPAGQLDELVWRDLCEVLTHPTELTQALERAHGGDWLPQALQARRENLRQGRLSLRQQIDRLTEAYLHNVIPLPEYERRRHELEERDHALAEQEHQLSAQAERHEEVAGLTLAIDDFCTRIRAGLANATFEQRRQLIELLIDRVIVTDSEVEIRYVIPTHPRSEHVRFCHLRKDYFNSPVSADGIGQRLSRELAGTDVEPLFQAVGMRAIGARSQRIHSSHRRAVRPEGRIDNSFGRQHPGDLDHDTPMAVFQLVMGFGKVMPVDEGICQLGFECGLVALDAEQVVAAQVTDLPGDGLLAAHGIDADQQALHIQGFEQLRNGSDLVAFLGGTDLTQHPVQGGGVGADPVDWRALGRCTPDGLAVNRDTTLQPDHQAAYPAAEASLKFLRVHELQEAQKRVLRRNAMPQAQKTAQPGFVGLRPQHDLIHRIAIRQRRRHQNHQHFLKIVQCPVARAPRIVQARQTCQQRSGFVGSHGRLRQIPIDHRYAFQASHTKLSATTTRSECDGPAGVID